MPESLIDFADSLVCDRYRVSALLSWQPMVEVLQLLLRGVHVNTQTHKRETERKGGGGSVSSKNRPQQQHSLKYFIASSPEMKKEGAKGEKEDD